MTRLAGILLALLLTPPPVQPPAILKIKITIVDADGKVRPVPRHALLISDNPVSAAPQRVVTTIEGTADVRLKPGNYTIESDEPLIFQGKAYEWAQTIDVPGGRDTLLELTAANAEVGTPVDVTSGAARGASALLIEWQDSVVSVWSPTQLGSGFVIDARGLIATNQRLVGKATDVEVQFSPSKKSAARVIAADPAKDVAILWIDPAALGVARRMNLGYTGVAAVSEKDKLYAIEAPLDDRKSLASGIVSKVTSRTVVTNINLDETSAGVPLMTADGQVVALTTTSDDQRAIHDVAPAAIRIDELRGVVAEAEKRMLSETPPRPRLPVEPERAFEDDQLKEAAKARAGRAGAYIVGADDFDVAIVTPPMLYAARHREERTTGAGPGGRSTASVEEIQKSIRALQSFSNWDDYVGGYPPVVMLRVTPRLVEGFWTSVGRAAAQSQGVDIPAIKHLKAGFARLQLYCGDAEVTPIHPFRIEQRVSEREFVYEGLYVFAPDAISPQCKVVKLTLFSDKQPDKGDLRTIDAKIVQQVWDDFAPYRAAAPK